ncbi:MAG: HNH endonuclease [Pseudomonadales bacterium]
MEGESIYAGTRLHPETVRRLACDGGLLTIIESPRGDPLNVGRKTRAIPPSTRRALVARDRHCQFPGCSQERYVEGHHIKHWAHGGETRPDNLVLLCSRHHRAVHELGYRIERTLDGELRFISPGGR